MNTPVLLLTFNRFDCLKKAFLSIKKASPKKLYIASDGPRKGIEDEKEKIDEIRQWLLQNVDWECEVKTRFLDENSGGCHRGVKGAIDWFFAQEKEGIILEDDCVANLSFFSFCEELLERYRENKQIWHISGDAPVECNIKESYYFSKIEHCWGWASWADRWEKFEDDLSKFPKKNLKKFDRNFNVQKYWRKIQNEILQNKIDSWAYRWTFSIVNNEGLCITPAFPLVSNIGEEGVHYNKGPKNSFLNKKTFEIAEIIHPKKIGLNKRLVRKIYAEKFKIKLWKLINPFKLV